MMERFPLFQFLPGKRRDTRVFFDGSVMPFKRDLDDLCMTLSDACSLEWVRS